MAPIIPGVFRSLRQIQSDRSGSIPVLTVMLLVVMIGFAALGIQLTMLFAQERRMQAAADAAVVAAARPGLNEDQSNTETFALAGTYGFVNGGDTKVDFKLLSATSGYGAGAAEVVIEKTFQPGLLSLFSRDPIKIRVRSIAAQQSLSAGCLLALNKTAERSIFLGPSASVNNPSCEMVVNSNNIAGALYVSNKGNVLGPFYVVGGVFNGNNTQLTGAPQIVNAGTPVQDPYQSVEVPVPSGNCVTSVVSKNTTLSPGYYCSITVNNGAILTLNGSPSTPYIIDGNFSMGRGSRVSSTSGLTIVLGNSSSVDVGNNSIVHLTAPLSGATAGLVFMSRQRTDTTPPKFSIGNNSTFTIEGALYLPGWLLSVDGVADTSGANCTQYIADQIHFFANLAIKADCGGAAVRPIGRSQPSLVQ